MTGFPLVVFLGLLVLLPFVWLWFINKMMTAVPPEALALSPHRWTVSEIRDTASQISQTPLNTLPYLPPATGRRYIVVGGSGFVGGWIVLHLLLRGENPKNIRIVDIRRRTRKDMLTGKALEVGFVAADIQDLTSVREAFATRWPTGADTSDAITVIHTAAGLRYYERHPSLLARSAVLNVEGTRNVLFAAKEAGVGIFIFTSSGSIPVRSTNFWFWPWQKRPETLIQIINDSSPLPKKQSEYFSNYAYTKFLAEKLVREADDPKKGFRTGCIRPGSGIYGSGGDLFVEAYLKSVKTPSWLGPMIQSAVYVENVSYAHLLYEARLLDALAAPENAPVQKLGGETYLITDSGKPVAYDDLYLALSALTNNHVTFPPLPASPILVVAYLIEAYHLLQSLFPSVLPPIKGDVVKVQPALFNLTMIHLRIDDSRARLPCSEGGLGYQGPWSTLDGVCQVVSNHLEGEEGAKQAVSSGHGSIRDIKQH
ncbi:hypothetical protein NLJ89_g1636 [Agrocybe chaxingu]|uniref:3-beta hydroxysteroid dehydrogenase/isomerase domain-containing protein n=1 Tax=Agrocybe chaxingu TaxID=84603 RepID=A0A9W8MZM9_9AGAR|nr:hypothetical protein NLJ89_g1636 [Agrocybe chaxingu]